MNIHEYQAKELLKRFGVAVPEGMHIQSLSDVERVDAELSGSVFVVKSQIHAGGRGAGRFRDNENAAGGVRVVSSMDEMRTAVREMLNGVLVTKQTGPLGREVKSIYIEEACEIERELYLSLLVDRKTGCVTVISSTEGGIDIEEVAEKTPGKIDNTAIDNLTGLRSFHAQKISHKLGLSKEQGVEASALLAGIYRAFTELDAEMIEINPLVVTRQGRLLAVDAKMNFDENALFRQQGVLELRDTNEEDPTEIEAAKFDLNYVKLSGNIGCMVNGAGLAMATMDIIKLHGGDPANFLDVGGGATKERVAAAFKIIMSDTSVRGILVNIFGGIMRCNIIAEGVVSAAQEIDLSVPLVVRLEGTNVERGKEILTKSGLEIISADNLADAAQKIVRVVNGGN
ncbi:MAG: ADP-forming succinate--CoA ligase subunit beta [Rhodospirillaceae bacterium]|nr:ADP-forming succinate--CoA ligase subunit beta [Rhodospirillaceae bacterium]|tara:strand:- start:806 stop:2002 length:1197 start_codon:yes stop_codon:yes gene_type:complete